MADKNFGVKELNLIGASGTPTIDSPNNLNINAANVAISTDMTIGGTVNSSITVGSGYTFYGDGSGLTDVLTSGDVVTSIVAGTNITLTGGPTGIVTINSSGGAGYSNTDVDNHINVSAANNNEVLSWTGSDYDWVAQSGGASDINSLSDGFNDNSSIGLGSNALDNDDGNNGNVAIGNSALNGNTIGLWNVAIGQDAMKVSQNASKNVYIGRDSGINVISGQKNVAIGYGAGIGLTTGSNNILIGHNVTISPGNVSNKVIIGDSNVDKFSIPGIGVTLKDNGGTPTEGHVLTVDSNGEASFTASVTNQNLSGVVTATSFQGNSVTGDGSDRGFTTKYYITANGSSAYRFAGPGSLNTDDNPTLYFHRGFTYILENSTGSSHPFELRTSQGGSAYAPGGSFLTGSTTGTQILTVPFDAPNTIYYQCTIHSGMVGTINIVN